MTENAPDTATAKPPMPPGSQMTRVCRRCSVQSSSTGDFCPNCGHRYAGRRGPSTRLLIALAVVLVLLVGGVAAAYLAKTHHDQDVARKRAAAAAAAVKRAAEQKVAAQQAAREKAAAADDAERQRRHLEVTYLEQTITKDARKDVAAGNLSGPILHTSCTAMGGGSTDDLTAVTGKFDCLAVTTKSADGTERGYSYSGTIEYKSARITWQLQ